MNAPFNGMSELLPVSLEALWRFRLRTALSVLGVVIGIAAMIAMLSVSEGGRRAVLRQVEQLGLRNLVVVDQSSSSGARGRGLWLSDAHHLEQLLPSVSRVAAVSERRARVKGPSGSSTAALVGITPDYLGLRQHSAGQGRLLAPFERGQQQVCVIGGGLSRLLFQDASPIGDVVSVDNRWYTVVGVLQTTVAGGESDEGLVRSADHDLSVLVPLPALFGHDQMSPDQHVAQVWIEAAPNANPLAIKPLVEHTLTVLHNDVANFQVVAARELLAQHAQTQRTFNVVVGSIAALALLVGGIGIMNIMLASVLERTAEIGLRRTVGATRQWILGQFVIEAVVMTGAGGVLGVVAGAAVAAGITAYAGWPVHVSAAAVAAAVASAVGVGLSFGIYPALRAARLQPIDAVRAE
jgi:putative ABC transport system permease protein